MTAPALPASGLPALDRRRATPLHRQIYLRYRQAIESGLLKPGERVASARNLAAELGVARGTVEAAYAQLAGEGYLQPRGQAGTVVAELVPAARGVARGTPLLLNAVAADTQRNTQASLSPHVRPEPNFPGGEGRVFHRSQRTRPSTGSGRTEGGYVAKAGVIAVAGRDGGHRDAARKSKDGDTSSLPRLSPTPQPLQLGIPALDAFPRKLWTRLANRVIRATTPEDLHYGDPTGLPALREAIARYLLVSRGVACAPEQVIVTGGHRHSLALIARLLLKPGDTVWAEDPGYPAAREVLLGCGARLAYVPVDAEGVRVEDGVQRAANARLALVTPSHQAPLGVSLSLARRLQLLQWAARKRAWVVEDDYDGEYRYSGPPLPALKSLDARDRVIYAGSFSKVLFPALTLSYLVFPAQLALRAQAASRLTGNGPPHLTQAIVAAFMAGGHFARHLKKMRLLYARRRTLLADALREAFGERIAIDLTAGGMHLIVRFPGARGNKGSDIALARRAQEAGLMCRALSERAQAKAGGQGLLMGFTNVATEQQACALAQRLRKALAP